MPVPFGRDAIRGSIPQNFIPSLDDEKGTILDYSPGLTDFLELPNISQIRGMRGVGNYIYAAAVMGNTSRAYKIDLTAGYIELGTINSGLGPVWIEDNGVQVAFNDGTTGEDIYVYTIATGVFAQVTDADFPGASGLVTQDGYGIFPEPNSGRFWLTGLYDYTSIDPLDFATAEALSDNLIGLISDHRELILGGINSSEVWQNAGTSPFPFARIPGGMIEEGLVAPKSLIKADNSVGWITPKRQVVKLDGYTPKIISTRKIERELEGYSVIDDAIGFSFTWRGHLMMCWIFPTADSTIVYDVATQVWWRWASSAEETRYRGNCYAFVNGRHFIGDYNNGKIYELDGDVYTDSGDTIRRKLIISGITCDNGRVSFPYLQTDWEQGVGLEDNSIPQVMLRISNDGGNTWSSEWWQEAGQVGEYSMLTRWNGLGSIDNAQERVYEIVVTDPIPWRLLGVKHPIVKV